MYGNTAAFWLLEDVLNFNGRIHKIYGTVMELTDDLTLLKSFYKGFENFMNTAVSIHKISTFI